MSTSGKRAATPAQTDPASVATLADLAALLRGLRRREARRRHGKELTYQQLAERTGWSVSVIGEYLTGVSLPPTDRFDTLVQLLGAQAEELGGYADARDRVADARRRREPERAGPVPRELPANPTHFVGRTGELARLDAVAFEGDPGTVRIAVVTGMGGVGKTALALRWAHQAAVRYPDGQLYVDLRGYDDAEPVDPADTLAGLLRSLGVNPAEVPATPAERAARYRTLLAGRRVLVVLDNARTDGQVRPLLPGSPLCLVLVTSRDLLAGLVSAEAAVRVPVDPLPIGESTALLRRAGGGRFDATPDEAEALARYCGGVPLAIRVAADVATRRAGVPVPELVDDLRDERLRLDVLDTGDPRTTMRSVLSWSYQTLSGAAARLFRLSGCAPSTHLSARAVASLAGLAEPEVRRLLTELTGSHLLTETAAQRYGMHDVLHAYAAELAQAQEAAAERAAAVHRLLDHYLGTAAVADRLLQPSRFGIDSGLATPEDSPYIARVDSAEDAQRWFDAERGALLAAVPLAVRYGYPEHAWQLPWAMASYLDRGGYWHEWSAASAIALEATTDPAAQARLHDMLARAASPLGLVDTTIDHFQRALALLEGLGDQFGQALIHNNLVKINGESGRLHAAAGHSRYALALFRQLGHVVGQAAALNNLAMIHVQLGEYAEGLPAAREALALVQEAGNRRVEANVLDSLGALHRGLGEYDHAVDHHRRALALFEEVGDRLQVATAWTNVGDAHAGAHRYDDAHAAWRAALEILDDLNHPDAAPVRARLRAGAGG